MYSKEEAKIKLAELIKDFESNSEKNKLSEDDTRTFIDKMFEILGWKMSPPEVSKQEKVFKGFVDYAFKINNVPVMFVEAKKTSENLINIKFYNQVTDYAWHKATTWAVLTNFKHTRIINAYIKGNYQASILHDIEIQNYLNQFDDLWLLSKESFEQKLIDKAAERAGKKATEKPVEKALFEDLNKWRQELANDIKKNYGQKYSTEEIDEMVQVLLDRFILVRKIEDEGHEDRKLEEIHHHWLDAQNKKSLWMYLRELFTTSEESFEQNYDSKIFEYSEVDKLEISDYPLKIILKGLYESEDQTIRYNFALIDADILGNIYEQYLGYILKTTAKKASGEKSKTKRKEQGIYYTPRYIVDYIVKNTVGEKLKECKNWQDVEKIKILDPACGSGSFLIKAFDEIYYWYEENKISNKLFIVENSDKNFETPKDRIIKNNIFGVDLDPKAVEIAQLNLLLKTTDKKHKLPQLRDNIKTGNSLINDKKVSKSAFNWNDAFSNTAKNEGFDIIIGNPPYKIVFETNEKHFLENNYTSFKRNNDLYVAFIEKSIDLLMEDGIFGFIVPNTYLIGSYFDNLKKLILEKTKIIKIINFGTNQVFEDPNVFNSILILQKESNKELRNKNIINYFETPLLNKENLINVEKVSFKTNISQNQFNDLNWAPKNNIIDKIYTQSTQIVDNQYYVKDVGLNYWSVGRGKKRGDSIGSKVLYEGQRKNLKDIPYLKGRDIIRYGYVFGNHWLRHDFEKFLNKKVDIFRFSANFLTVSPKIIYRQTADRIIATLDFDKYYLDKTVHLIIPKENAKLDINTLLGILNSKLMLFIYRDATREEGRTFAQVKTIYIKKIPLKFDKLLEKEISDLVIKQIELRKLLNKIGDKLTVERERFEQEMKGIDKEIDYLVYELYGITEEEKKIIEESLK